MQNQKYVVIFNQVVDLSKYSGAHKGGRFLDLFYGQDMTMPFLGAHQKNAKALKHVKKLSLGRVNEPVSIRDQELYNLYQNFEKQGFFKVSILSILLSLLRILVFTILAFFMASFAEGAQFFALIFLTAAFLESAWIIHDAGHFSVFASERLNRFFIDFWGILMLGTPQRFYHTIDHRIHHATTNTIGYDGAVKVGKIIWNSQIFDKQAKQFPFWLQPLIWFGIILPLTYPALFVLGIVSSIFLKSWISVLMTILRWWAVVYYLPDQLALVFISLLLSGYLVALISSLNHFHLPMGDRLETDFSAQVFKRTQNLKNGGKLMTWFTGGLNYHIEHHVFPTMPRGHYPKVQKQLKAFAKKYQLPYHESGFGECLRTLFVTLLNPLKNDSNAICLEVENA